MMHQECHSGLAFVHLCEGAGALGESPARSGELDEQLECKF